MSQVTQALRERNLRFREEENHVVFGMRSGDTTLRMVVSLTEEGEYIDVSAVGIEHCPAGHPKLADVLEVLAHANYSTNMVKFGWDPADGEIRARACLPIEDNPTVTTEQLHGLIMHVAVGSDSVLSEVKAALGGHADKAKNGGCSPAIWLLLLVVVMVAGYLVWIR
jgi:hypothetical protein